MKSLFEVSEKVTPAMLALCAYAFFRRRWEPRPAGRRRGKRARAAAASFDYYYHLETVRIARTYARAARAAGWRGTFLDAAHNRSASPRHVLPSILPS